MGVRLVIIGLVLGLIALALTLLSDPDRMNQARVALGMEPLRDFGVAELEPEAIEAEVARLEGLALPAVPADAPPDSQVTVADYAKAARGCLEANRTVLRPPKQRAEEALRRYLVALGATAAAPGTPLLTERFRPLGALVADAAALQAAAEGRLAPEAAALLAAFHADYADVDHPLYNGLQLYGQTFEGLDFQALAGSLAAEARPVAACTVATLWPEPEPAPAAAPAAAQPAAAVAWECGGAALRVTALATEPPGLLVERDGRAELGVQVEAASGTRYEGPFGAWVAEGADGAGARLERPDGTVESCEPAGG